MYTKPKIKDKMGNLNINKSIIIIIIIIIKECN
jgi:hypothetical protein